MRQNQKGINITGISKMLILLLLWLPIFSFSQDAHYIDSLKQFIHQIEEECLEPCEKDTLRMEAYSEWYYAVYRSYPDSALRIANEVIELCEERLSKNSSSQLRFPITMWYAIFVANKGTYYYQKGDSKSKLKYELKALDIKEQLYRTTTDSTYLKDVMQSLGYSYINLGGFYHDQGIFDTTFYYYDKAMEIQNKSNDLRGISVTLNNISNVYIDQGRMIEALDYALRSLRIKEDMLNHLPTDRNKNVFLSSLCASYNNIGWFYDQQTDYKKAEGYYRKALKIATDIDHRQYIHVFMRNIGKTYEARKDYSKALSYYTQSLEIQQSLGNINGKILSLNSIGRIYVYIDQEQKGVSVFKTALHLSDSIDDIAGKATSLNNLNWVYEKNHDYNKLAQYAKKGYEASQRLGDIEQIIKATEYMSKVAAYQKDYKNAYQYHKLMVQLKDSVNNEKTVKETFKKQAEYEYEKKSAVDSVAHYNQIQIKNLEITRVEEEKEQQRTIIYLFVGGFIIILVFLVIIYRLMREKSKANKKLMELDQFKRNMSSMIVHDLKNPLNVIMGMSEKMEVKEAAGKMNRLVMNILDTQKFEDTQVELQYKDHVLNHLVEASFEQVAYLAESKDIQLTNAVPADLVIKVDEELVTRVVVNLLL
ncbi:MAG: tetratricopeptide repeat-containing sensor histidine kinase, partial [Flavobacteriales bacterium]|nr:tetratricopeptide repeat-containing sensor histidine kinase [Flavobacteriales bacterium]